MRVVRPFVLAAFVLAGPITPAQAQPFEGLPPSHATAVEVANADAPIFLAGRRGAPRRGTLARGSRFTLRNRLRGDGCSSGVWAEIAPSTYVCDADVRYGRFAPEVQAHPVLAPGALLPYAYGFVMVDGARSYAHPQDYFTDQYYEALGIGFGVIVDRREFYEGLEFVRTRRRLFIPANSVRMARGSDFVGVVLDDAGFTGSASNVPGSPTGANAPGEATADAAERSAQPAERSAQSAERSAAETVGPLSIAWSRRSVAVRSRRGGGRRLRTLGRRTAVRVRAIERRWAELEDGGFVRVRDLHRPERQPAP
ncbi:MAG: hypothetical protein AAF938_10765, partial [Myxococcota bacterium]